MPRRLTPLARLLGDQLRASDPRDHAALSASAGTGKTHVLTARVLRLLLSGVEPSSILCLTFTKAAAAEMADRIHSRLASWVRLEDKALRKELFALSEDNDEEAVRRARTLFARVLDAHGGGLRIQTIHAFAQSLLANFPSEAGLVPGFRPLEGREEQLLARQTLADLLVRAERGGDERLVADLQTLSHRLGEGSAESFLMQCARAPAAMAALGADQGIEARLRRVFDLPAGDIEESIAAECSDLAFDIGGLKRLGLLNSQWGSAKGMERSSLCEAWIAANPAERAALLEALHGIWAKKDGEIRSFARGQAPADEDYPELARSAFDCCHRLLTMRRTAVLVAELAAGLRAGQAFAAAYSAAKRDAGVADFDDLIRWAEQLLLTPGIGEWVRYKLDQSVDHVLVDEAQDTNERQWNIVRALTLEYFSGEGATGRSRTVFTVGDFKQAIYGFQGTDPQRFEIARAWFSRRAAEVERDFLDLAMDLNFRSAPPILTFVDTLLSNLGPEAFGLPRPANPHECRHTDRAGAVVLWKPFGGEGDETLSDEGEEGWISDTVRAYARTLARQIRVWIEQPFEVAGKDGKGRPVKPEDILVLVRRRGELASLIVARLHAEGVPVAGVDRLLLSAPLAVQDLLAAMRFAIQPLDDLNLAALLVSPLFGWTQDELFDLAHARRGALWPRLRETAAGTDRREEALAGLGSLLAMADYATPHQFLQTILSGHLDGRRKLLERLGPEARDPIEELVASALDFETRSAPSLQHFLDWFARGDVEIVRDPSAPFDAVRVMTVHGAKGLQAPVVILADACVDPTRKAGDNFARMEIDEEGTRIPIFRPRRNELAEPLKSQLEAQEKRDREEHWRLFYVAMTRAEDRLYVGGALGAADRNGPAAESWYKAAETALAELDCAVSPDPLWGQTRRYGDLPKAAALPRPSAARPAPLPVWVRAPAPAESRPPRPLTPSAPGEDDSADPPPTAGMRAGAERGRILHQLFERLPGLEPSRRGPLAEAWLERALGIDDAAERRRLVEDACAIVSDPLFQDLFSGAALAEAPIAAVIAGGHVVTGTVDRLLVGADRIRFVDFKTGRTAPASEAAIPRSHLRQMAAYAAALEVIFPGLPIEASLLYTAAPVLYRLDPGSLGAYLPATGDPAPVAG